MGGDGFQVRDGQKASPVWQGGMEERERRRRLTRSRTLIAGARLQWSLPSQGRRRRGLMLWMESRKGVEKVFFLTKVLSTFRCAQTLKTLFAVVLNQKSKTSAHYSTPKSGNTKCWQKHTPIRWKWETELPAESRTGGQHGGPRGKLEPVNF